MEGSVNKHSKQHKSRSQTQKKDEDSASEILVVANQLEPAIKRVPPEIWDIITTHVDSSQDLRSLSVAVPICGQLLEPKKTEWIFDDVLPVVLTNTSYLTRKDILNCRLVCHRWNYAVENLFEIETAVMQDFSDISNPRQDLGYLGLQRYLGHYDMLPEEVTPSKIAKLLKEFGNCAGNPIFGKYLEITIPGASKRDRRLIKRFLKTFGHLIYFIDANCKRETHPQVFIDLLLDLVEYMPNLKHIGIRKVHWPTEENWMIMGNHLNLRQHYAEKLRDLPPLKACLHSLFLREIELEIEDVD